MSFLPKDDLITFNDPVQRGRIELLVLLNILTELYSVEIQSRALVQGEVMGEETGKRYKKKLQTFTNETEAFLPQAFMNAELDFPEFILGDFAKTIECAKLVENMINAAELDERDRIAPDHL